MKKNESSSHSSNSDRLSRESLRREWNVMRFAWQMAKRYHLMLIILMILEIILGVLPTMAIYFFQDAVSGAGNDILSIVTKGNFLFVILFIALYLLLQKGSNVITTFAIIDVEYNIRMQYLSKMLAFSAEDISYNFDSRSAFGMTRETSMTSSLIPMICNSLLRAPVAIVSAIVLMMLISTRMVALVSLMMLIIIGAGFLMRDKLKYFNRMQNNETSSLLQYFNEWLTGHRIFRVYGAVNFYERKMTSTFDTISDVSRKHKLYGATQSLLVELLTYIAIILFLIFLPDSNGYINIGIVVSFPAVILIIRNEIIKLVGGYQQLANTESSISRLQLVLQMETPSNDGLLTWNEQIENVELKNLSYWYDSHEKKAEKSQHDIILSHADLKLSKGHLNVITGPNGTGKSTTLNLILGLLEPKEGSVCYNGKDIKKYKKTSLYPQIAIVEQEPFVFQGSLLDNISLGRDISEELIKKYLHEFSLDYLIDDSGGLSLRIGAKGRILSSGEKQRLALIRALVGKPSVIILDEPTSNIDYATSALIRNAICELAKQHLLICVSHDLVMITNDEYKIFQIEDGNYIQRQNSRP